MVAIGRLVWRFRDSDHIGFTITLVLKERAVARVSKDDDRRDRARSHPFEMSARGLLRMKSKA